MKKHLLRAALLSVLSTIALALAACGSDSGTSGDLGPDPATMAPADAPFYAEVIVRPEGSVGDDLNSALSKLLGTDDPGAMVREKLDQAIADDPESGGATYTDDIEPWLGTRAGAFVSGYDQESGMADAAVAVAVTDTDAAQGFVDKITEGSSTSPTDESYEGVDYVLDSGTAYGIDGDFLLIGSQQGFEQAVDAGAGDALSENGEATDALDQAPEESLFSVYADGPAIVDLIKESGDLSDEEIGQIDAQIGALGEGKIEAWGTVTDSTFAFSASTPTPEGSSGQSELAAGFPAEAWLAFAVAGVGDQIQQQIDQLESAFQSSSPSADADAAPGGGGGGGAPGATSDPLGEFERQTGIDLKNDFSWIGDAGGFVQGTSLLGLGAGLVLEATDEDAASATLAKVQKALQSPQLRGQIEVTPSGSGDGFQVQPTGLPVSADVALQDGKVVVAIGADSVDDVLSPAEALDGSDRFNAAKDALGVDATPALFLDFAPVVDLIESSGQVDSDPDYQAAKPYLDALDFLASGSSVDGDRTTGSLVLGVKDAD